MVQVLRFEGRATLDDALVRHVRGVTRPPTAREFPGVVSVHDPVRLGAVVDLGGDGVEAAREAIAAATAKPRRGRKPKHAIDVMIAGPPSYGPEQWSDARELQWARDSVAWARGVLGPESVVVAATLHRDETSPHLHVLAVPIERGRISWKAVRDRAAKGERDRLGDVAGRKSRGAHRDAYRTLQDGYQAAVGSRFGLGRGEVGSEATHVQIDRAQAAEHRAELAESRLAEARAQARDDAAQWQRERAAAERRATAAAERESAAAKAAQAAELRVIFADTDAGEAEARAAAAAGELGAARAALVELDERHRANTERAAAAEHELAARLKAQLREVREVGRELEAKRKATREANRAIEAHRAELERAGAELKAKREASCGLDDRERQVRERSREVGAREVAVHKREVRADGTAGELEGRARLVTDRETAAAERESAAAQAVHDAEVTLSRLQREAGEAKRERDEAERDAGATVGFDAAGFAGLVLHVADRLRVALPERLADALGRVVERRSAAPVFQLARLLIREERSRSAAAGRDEPHKRRERGRGRGRS